MMRRILLAALLVGFSAGSVLSAASENVPRLIANGRVDEALTTLRGQISQTPGNAEAYNLLCRAYFTLGDWDRGISACEKSVTLGPDNSRFHLWLGRVYGEKADHASWMTAAGLAKHVRVEFEAAVQLDPKSVDARSDLAEFYLEAPGIVGGGRDKAELQTNVVLSLDAAKGHWLLGRLAEKKHDLSAAEAEYKKSIDASHGSAAAWLNLGLFYKHVERFDDMENALLHVRRAPIEDRPDALVDAAEILLHTQRNLPEAALLLRAYLNGDSKVEQAPAFKALFLLGTAGEKMGDKREAADQYRAALALAQEFRPAREALQRVAR
jgi:tetratricopeptide (TPR) repeat protein